MEGGGVREKQASGGRAAPRFFFFRAAPRWKKKKKKKKTCTPLALTSMVPIREDAAPAPRPMISDGARLPVRCGWVGESGWVSAAAPPCFFSQAAPRLAGPAFFFCRPPLARPPSIPPTLSLPLSHPEWSPAGRGRRRHPGPGRRRSGRCGTWQRGKRGERREERRGRRKWRCEGGRVFFYLFVSSSFLTQHASVLEQHDERMSACQFWGACGGGLVALPSATENWEVFAPGREREGGVGERGRGSGEAAGSLLTSAHFPLLSRPHASPSPKPTNHAQVRLHPGHRKRVVGDPVPGHPLRVRGVWHGPGRAFFFFPLLSRRPAMPRAPLPHPRPHTPHPHPPTQVERDVKERLALVEFKQ